MPTNDCNAFVFLSVLYFLAMAAANIIMDPDLTFLLNDAGLPRDLQEKIGAAGFRTVRLFSMMADDRAGMRELLTDEPFLLNATATGEPGSRVEARAKIALIISAWETAAARSKELNRADAERRAVGLPLAMPEGEQVGIRRDFEALFGRKKDKDFPDFGVIMRRLQQVDHGELSAEPLCEVASRYESKSDMPDISWIQGGLRLRQPIQKVADPKNTEEFRHRISLLATTYEIVKMRHPHHARLTTANRQVWDDHVAYVLGDTVWGLCATEPFGGTAKVEWGIVMVYEHELRREAVRLIVYEMKDIAAAMKEARQDQELRSLKLVTPALAQAAASAASAAVAASSSRLGPPPPPPYRGNDRSRSPVHKNKGGKGGGKKGKGKRPGHGDRSQPKSNKEYKTTTPDGKPICFRFNKAGCNDRTCAREHVCQLCMGPHPAHACTR